LSSLVELGVRAASVVDKMPFEMEVHRQYAHYRPENIEDVPIVEDPVPLTRVQQRDIVRQGKISVLDHLGLKRKEKAAF
jgi:hypothetical protein